MQIVGVDVGGSHITAALVDLETRSLVPGTLQRNQVDSHGSASKIIAAWSFVIGNVMKFSSTGKTKIGMAMPGPFDYENGISLMKSMNKYEALYELNVKKLLAAKLGLTLEDIFMRNDAESFLAGEVMGGAARGYEKVIGVTLGTGLGTAVHANGKTCDAALGVNIPFLDGVAEDYISTRWFIKRYYELTGKKIPGVKELMNNLSSDNVANEVFEEFRKNLLAFLTIFIEKDIPEVVVVGGNIANALDNYYDEMQLELRKKFPKIFLKKALLGENAALIGAVFF